MSKRQSGRRLQGSIVDLHRIVNSRKLHGVRAQRSGVDVSPVAAAVLRHVVEDGPMRPAELADRLRMRPNTLTRHLNSLAADGAIERVPVPEDGRGWLVQATGPGRMLVHRLEEADDAILAEQLRAWSATDLELLATLMERLVDDLRAPSPTGADQPHRDQVGPR